MRIGAADERRGLEDLDAGDVVDAEEAERGDLLAGASGDAEDAGVVEGGGAEEEVVAEEEGEGEDLGGPEARGGEVAVDLGKRRCGFLGAWWGTQWIWVWMSVSSCFISSTLSTLISYPFLMLILLLCIPPHKCLLYFTHL